MQSNTKSAVKIALIAVAIVGILAGCNTIAGAGKDVEKAGEAVQDTSKDVSKKL